MIDAVFVPGVSSHGFQAAPALLLEAHVKLNHLDLQVADVQKTALFFERYFGLGLQSSRTSPAIAILGDGEGFVLVLQRRKADADTYPEGFHLGFVVEHTEVVRRVHRQLRDDGADVSEVIENNRGMMIYCRTPDRITVEVSWHRPRGKGPEWTPAPP